MTTGPDANCPLCQSPGGRLLRSTEHWRVILATDAPLPEVHRVVSQAHVREFSELSPEHRAEMMSVVAEVEADLIARLRPDKINLASLGNRVSHLHWHVMPRFRTDPFWPDSLWSSRRPAVVHRLQPTGAEPPLTLEVDGWDSLEPEARAVRQRVFVEEQGVDPAEEWELADAWARHAVVRCGTEVVATGRILSLGPGPTVKCGRMAVLPAWRGRGLGQAVLEALLDEAEALGFADCLLHAQCAAMGFYVQAGFEPEGEVFSEAGIAHQRMRLALARRRRSRTASQSTP